AASATYVGALPALPDAAPLAFLRRSRRLPRDPVNAPHSLAYTLAHAQGPSALALHRLHPYVRFLPEDRPAHVTLAGDALEPARPASDTFVLATVRRGQIAASDFDRADAGGCYLADRARGRFLEAYEHALRRPSDAATRPPTPDGFDSRRTWTASPRRSARTR